MSPLIFDDGIIDRLTAELATHSKNTGSWCQMNKNNCFSFKTWAFPGNYFSIVERSLDLGWIRQERWIMRQDAIYGEYIKSVCRAWEARRPDEIWCLRKAHWHMIPKTQGRCQERTTTYRDSLSKDQILSSAGIFVTYFCNALILNMSVLVSRSSSWVICYRTH